MAKHNYSQYSKKKSRPEVETDALEVKMEVERSETAAMPEIVATPTIDLDPVVVAPALKPTTGTVVNCAKLNVRSEPETTADILCVLNVGSEVKVDRANSTDEWFKITNAAGIDGYCMRKFVKI